jgi:hypothetical protein
MTRIELLQPHTHAGRVHAAGDRIDVHAADAEWLIGLGKARAAEPGALPTTTETSAARRKEKA